MRPAGLAGMRSDSGADPAVELASEGIVAADFAPAPASGVVGTDFTPGVDSDSRLRVGYGSVLGDDLGSVLGVILFLVGSLPGTSPRCQLVARFWSRIMSARGSTRS